MSVEDFATKKFTGHPSDKHGSLKKGQLAEKIVAFIVKSHGHGVQATNPEIDRKKGIDLFLIKNNDFSDTYNIMPISCKATYSLPSNSIDHVRLPICGLEAHSPIPSLFNGQNKRVWMVLALHKICLFAHTDKLIKAISLWYPQEFETLKNTPWELPKLFPNSVNSSNMAASIMGKKIYLRYRAKTNMTDVIIFPTIEMIIKDAESHQCDIPKQYHKEIEEATTIL